MYANFYNKKNKCLYSVKVKDEREAEKRADYEYKNCKEVDDWTITKKAMSKIIFA